MCVFWCIIYFIKLCFNIFLNKVLCNWQIRVWCARWKNFVAYFTSKTRILFLWKILFLCLANLMYLYNKFTFKQNQCQVKGWYFFSWVVLFSFSRKYCFLCISSLISASAGNVELKFLQVLNRSLINVWI